MRAEWMMVVWKQNTTRKGRASTRQGTAKHARDQFHTHTHSLSLQRTTSTMSHCQDCTPRNANEAASRSTAPIAQVDQAAASSNTSSTSLPPALLALDISILPTQVEALQHQALAAVVIEFCDRCRWLHRAAWVQTELLLTFAQASSSSSTAPSRGAVLHSSTLVPLSAEDTGGRFRVWLVQKGKAHLISDRKSEGGFPEVKVLVSKGVLDTHQPSKHADLTCTLLETAHS